MARAELGEDEANADDGGRNTAAKVNRAKAEAPMTNDALIEEINSEYPRLNGATEELASADRKLAEHIRRVRSDSAEAILKAKNERTASLYLDTDEHRRLESDRTMVELDLEHAKREVERLHLIVRLLGIQGSEAR